MAAALASAAHPTRLRGGAGGRGGTGRKEGEGDKELATLRAFCAKAEKYVETMEGQDRAKEQTLLKLQSQLEETLKVLQAGHKMYSEQQCVLEAQQAMVEKLSKKLATGPVVESCGSSGGGVQTRDSVLGNDHLSGSGLRTGLEAPLRDEAASALAELSEESDETMLNLMRRTQDLQRAAETAAAAKRGGADAPALVAQLNALMAEKDKLEEQLRKEQAELEEQLSSLVGLQRPQR